MSKMRRYIFLPTLCRDAPACSGFWLGYDTLHWMSFYSPAKATSRPMRLMAYGNLQGDESEQECLHCMGPTSPILITRACRQ